MISSTDLTAYLDELLDVAAVPGDPSNNGLQVEGGDRVAKVVFGVDACLGLFDAAVQTKAQFAFVHHGLSWGGNFKRLRGLKAMRLRRLFANGVSLYAAHLPLDAHPELGHNALIAEALGLTGRRRFGEYAGIEIGVAGELPEPLAAEPLVKRLQDEFGGVPRTFGNVGRSMSKVGVISGAAGADGVAEAARLGLECLVTGEIGHESFHLIRDAGLTVVGLGHYLSEKPGVLAVMRAVEERFDLECEFVDLPTGL